MGEELVQNVVMDEKFVKNFVMKAKIDPKVVEENELHMLLIGIPTVRNEFLIIQHLERPTMNVDQNVEESNPLREDLHDMMQCYGRQYFVASNDCMNIQEDTRRGENLRG